MLINTVLIRISACGMRSGGPATGLHICAHFSLSRATFVMVKKILIARGIPVVWALKCGRTADRFCDMAQRFKSWIGNEVANSIRSPKKGLVGALTTRHFLKTNSYLEENAVRLCDIKPDHRVLELCFGPGVGLNAAYDKIKGGQGKVYGIDTSFYMIDKARKRLKRGVNSRKVMLFHGSASNIPLNTDSVNRVFHCNCYYFWPNMRLVMREIYRVMRPGAMMVTTINLQRIKILQEKGYLVNCSPDPVKYMTCLENYGFEGVHLEYLNDPASGKPFQAIFAEVREKPAHDTSMLSDEEDTDIEEAPLKDLQDYEKLLEKRK